MPHPTLSLPGEGNPWSQAGPTQHGEGWLCRPKSSRGEVPTRLEGDEAGPVGAGAFWENHDLGARGRGISTEATDGTWHSRPPVWHKGQGPACPLSVRSALRPQVGPGAGVSGTGRAEPSGCRSAARAGRAGTGQYLGPRPLGLRPPLDLLHRLPARVLVCAGHEHWPDVSDQS